MSDTPRYVTLSDYLRVVRGHRILIVFTAILFGAAALAYSLRQDRVYAAESAIAFSDPTEDLELIGTPIGPRQPAGERAAIGADYVERNLVVKKVSAAVDIDDTEELRDKITARPEARTNLVVIEARDGDARRAALIANAFARETRDATTAAERERLDRIADRLREEYKEAAKGADRTARTIYAERVARVEALRDFAEPVAIAKTAGVAERPVEPKPIRNTVLGVLLGLTLGLLLAFSRDALDRRLRTADAVREAIPLPMLGQLSADALGRSALSVNGNKPFPPADAEAVRILRANLSFLAPGGDVRVLLVTSAMPEEGKSTVASALSVAAARAAHRVLLLECDLRQPSLTDRLGLARSSGLAELITGKAGWHEVRQELDVGDAPGSVTVVTAGADRSNPAELLGSPPFRTILDEARQSYDLVILDGTPLLSVVDARELQPRVDAVLLCVRAAQTTRDQAKAARDALERLPDRPTALVVTGVKHRDEVAYGYYAYSSAD